MVVVYLQQADWNSQSAIKRKKEAVIYGTLTLYKPPFMSLP